ncbi:hypothetical protein PPERSA_10071 [Pseudocohnilembus persalinus]|uniref:Tubulin-tyrosine ligase family n=1 Tax=Pseudocohnilembus persalinus TaxID=266149 RepID=A0A0V0QJR6_PSEPJ|nr:hypothetical protein PPERSA_10071 [Pseudocohnilembus persalinus]|eukprot:KRX02454.1 hypothetical protein PPERSA_10071 [Pseudocohnilembus persalinus]
MNEANNNLQNKQIIEYQQDLPYQSHQNYLQEGILIAQQQQISQDIQREKLYKKKEAVYHNPEIIPTDNSYKYICSLGNNGQVIKRVLETRDWWKETPSYNGLYNFKWVCSSQNIKFDKLQSKNQKNKITGLKQMVNHFEGHREITTKSGLIKNFRFFCEANKINIFDITPVTFILDLQDQAAEFQLDKFCQFFLKYQPKKNQTESEQKENHKKIIYEIKKRMKPIMNSTGSEKSQKNSQFTKPKMNPSWLAYERYLWLIKPVHLNRGQGIQIFKNINEFENMMYEYVDYDKPIESTEKKIKKKNALTNNQVNKNSPHKSIKQKGSFSQNDNDLKNINTEKDRSQKKEKIMKNEDTPKNQIKINENQQISEELISHQDIGQKEPQNNQLKLQNFQETNENDQSQPNKHNQQNKEEEQISQFIEKVQEQQDIYNNNNNNPDISNNLNDQLQDKNNEQSNTQLSSPTNEQDSNNQIKNIEKKNVQFQSKNIDYNQEDFAFNDNNEDDQDEDFGDNKDQEDIKKFLNNPSIKKSSFVVQKYIENPLLIDGRKFDIRIWVLVTQNMDVYFFKEGYIRTSCEEFDIYSENYFVHLTNNAVQRYSNNYGQYENGNLITFQNFDKMMKELGYENCDFMGRIYQQMQDYSYLCMQSVRKKINPEEKENCFQIFGFDYIIDDDFNLWLIEINNNPCLEETSPYLQMIIPRMIDDMFKLTIDKIFPRKKIIQNQNLINQKNLKIKINSQESNKTTQQFSKEKQASKEEQNLQHKIEEEEEEEDIKEQKVYQLKQNNNVEKLSQNFPVKGYSDKENIWKFLGNLNDTKQNVIFNQQMSKNIILQKSQHIKETEQKLQNKQQNIQQSITKIEDKQFLDLKLEQEQE